MAKDHGARAPPSVEKEEAVIQAADSRRPRRWSAGYWTLYTATALPGYHKRSAVIVACHRGSCHACPERGERAAARQQHQEAVMSGRQGSASSAFQAQLATVPSVTGWQWHGAASFSFPPSLRVSRTVHARTRVTTCHPLCSQTSQPARSAAWRPWRAHAAAERGGAARKTGGNAAACCLQAGEGQCDDHRLKALGGAGTCGRHIHCAPATPHAAGAFFLCARTKAHCGKATQLLRRVADSKIPRSKVPFRRKKHGCWLLLLLLKC